MPIFKLTTPMLALMFAAWPSEGQIVSAPVIQPPSSVIVAGSQSVTLVPSTIALQITTPLTVFYGEEVDGLAQVTANDGSAVTGTVTFYDGTRSFCTLTLTNGANCPAAASSGFAAGTHLFTAVYSGDATHAAATSNAVTVTVTQDTTSTTLVSSANQVAAGGNVVYSAQVQGAHGAVAGTVEFFDGAGSMGSAALDGNGRTSLSVLMVAPGTHTITAVYGGSANSASSTSAALNEVVESPLAASTTTLAASANPVAAGESVSFTAKVAGGLNMATGVVTFVEGGTVLGSAVLNSAGVATWSTSALNVGSHSVVARYAGDAGTAASLSAALIETVNEAAPGGGFTLGLSQVTVNAGGAAVIPVMAAAGSSLARAMSVSCTGLPDEASCEYAAGTVRITTTGPRDCGTTTPYGTAGLPMAGPVLAGLLVMFVPRRRRAWKGLLAVICAVLVVGSVSGCGTGNCTDLGSRPGTYTVSVGLSGMSGVQTVKLVVKP